MHKTQRGNGAGEQRQKTHRRSGMQEHEASTLVYHGRSASRGLVMKRLFVYAGLLAALLGITPAQPLANDLNANSAMAVNIDQLNYYSTEWTLVDAFKKASGWVTGCAGNCTSPACPAGTGYSIFNTGEQSRLDLDRYGWVRSLPGASDGSVCYRSAAALVFVGNNRTRLSGQYVVLYEGEGTLSYRGGAQVVSRSPGRDVLNLPDGAGLVIAITATNPNNYIRNIRVIWPGGICNGNPFEYGENAAACTSQGKTYTSFEANYAAQLFHPLFLRDLRHYKAIRYMQLLRTNDNINTLVSWSQIPTPNHAFWNDPATSPPWKLAFKLSNTLQADAWINIPTKVDDAFVQSAALLARDTLHAPLKVYVEYGNEIWNNAYPYTFANQWVLQQGRARWGTGGDQNIVRQSWFGMRSQQMCNIWKQAWGAQADRVVCVMGGFSATPWINRQSLDCPLWASDPQNPTGANCAGNMDALAIAPYVAGYMGNPPFLPILQHWMQEADGGLNSLFAEIENVALPQVVDFIQRNATLASSYGLDLVAYEAGAHLIGTGSVFNDVAVTNLFLAANRDPRMGDMYTRYMNLWKDNGGKLNAIYNSVSAYSNYGSLGTKEYQAQPRAEAPKFDAIVDFVETTPCWWDGCARQ